MFAIRLFRRERQTRAANKKAPFPRRNPTEFAIAVRSRPIAVYDHRWYNTIHFMHRTGRPRFRQTPDSITYASCFRSTSLGTHNIYIYILLWVASDVGAHAENERPVRRQPRARATMIAPCRMTVLTYCYEFYFVQYNMRWMR